MNNMQGNSMQQSNNGCNGNSGVPNTNNVGNNNSTSICVAVITGAFCLATALIPVIVSYKKKNELEDKKTKNKMEVDDHKAWLDIKKNEEKNRQNLEHYCAIKKIDQEYKCINKQTVNQVHQISLSEWQDAFSSKFPIPEYSAILHLDIVLNCCPESFRPAMLMHMLAMYGALVFSKVRAVYLDGKKHSPSLQVVVEGAQGSGKGNFNDIFKLLFERIVNNDSLKLQAEIPNNIIQITGIEVSRARLQMMLAFNKGVHIYIMETEIDAVTESIKKKRGTAIYDIREV